MKKGLSIILGIVSILLLAGCQQNVKGNGQNQNEVRNVASFETIRLVGNYQANINIGPTQQVSVTADSNVVPYIETEVHGKTLIIQTKSGYNLQPSQTPVLDITVNKLSDIGILGNGTVNASGLNTDELDIKIMGAGTANISGKVNETDIKLIGSGQVIANNLNAEKAEVRVVGTGTVSVFASKKLEVSIAGAGKVQYYGEPREVEQKINGSGEVVGIPNVEKNTTQNPG